MDATITSLQPAKLPLAVRLSDALNPIVIKELRQAVQSRFVVTMLIVLLAIQLAAVGLYLIFSNPAAYDFTAGRTVFTILLGIMLVVSLIFVPAYTAVRMIVERSDTNVDLLFITTIKPRSIIAGKVLAAAVLIGLIFSACLPFMTFTYFLRGIDLPTVFVLLCLCFLIVLACSLIALLMACLPFGRVVKVFLGLVVLVICAIAFFAALGSAISMVQFGIGSTLDSWEFWGPALGVLGAALAVLGLIFVLCVALITPHSANRALPVRAYLGGVWLLTCGGGVALWSYLIKSHVPIIIWLVLLSCVLTIGFFAAVSEREEYSKRILRAVPLAAWKQLLAFLLFSGSAGGLLWALTMSEVMLGFVWLWWGTHPGYKEANDLRTTLIFCAGMLLYFYAYAVSGALLRRWLLKWLDSKWTWTVSTLLLSLGTILPVVCGFLFFFEDTWWKWDSRGILIGNPFVFGSSKNDKYYTAFALGFAAVVSLLNARWLWARWRAFQPLSGAGGQA
jgi:hypothetical protein